MTVEFSVITPAYNAAPYLREAVLSALAQPQVREVLLIEDGSADDTLSICRQLSAEYPHVRLFQHEGGANLGAGASRNRGIAESRCPYIAFLDADDFYLAGRFTHAAAHFEADLHCDGIYEAVATTYADEQSEQNWRLVWTENPDLTTLTRPIPPERLFEALLRGGVGHLHLDGLTLKADLLQRIGESSASLRVGQDTALCLQAAAMGRLIAGRLDQPVAMRRVHSANRITHWRKSPQQIHDLRAALAIQLDQWGQSAPLPDHIRHALRQNRQAHDALATAYTGIMRHDLRGFAVSRLRLLRQMLLHPTLCRNRLIWKRLLPDLPYHLKRMIQHRH